MRVGHIEQPPAVATVLNDAAARDELNPLTLIGRDHVFAAAKVVFRPQRAWTGSPMYRRNRVVVFPFPPRPT